ncbi:MAG: hypothetical protein HDS80_00360 [Bacteroidales bacterium]|nr:hypothetical protein [Bacteroidales bacterium]
MKRIILLFSMIVPLLINAQNRFEIGTTWNINHTGGVADPSIPVASWIEPVTLEQTKDSEYPAFYKTPDGSSEKEFVAYAKIDGEKVYFNLDDVEKSEWYLLYDFGMKVGDECDIYSPLYTEFTDEGNRTLRKTHVKCVATSETSVFSGLPIMVVMDDSNEYCPHYDLWLKGVSSISGLFSSFFNSWYAGGGRTLVDVVSPDGVIIYNYNSVNWTGIDWENILPLGEIDWDNVNWDTISVSEMTVSHQPKITITGLEIEVSIDGEANGSIYSVDGKHLGTYRLSETPQRINLSEMGLYIIKIGDRSFKFFVGA